MMLAVLSPLTADSLLSACEYGLSAGGDWSLALGGGMLGWFLFFHFVVSPIDPARQQQQQQQQQQTPYTLLGVTTDSSPNDITAAYYRMVDRARRTGHHDLVKARNDLLGCREAYETLTDPLLRCVYHRDQGMPDWYGVPKLCWGEVAVEKLQSARTVTRYWTGPEDAFARMPTIIMSTTTTTTTTHMWTQRFHLRSPSALVLATISTRTSLISARGSTQIPLLAQGQVSLAAELEIAKNAVLDYLRVLKHSLVSLKDSASSLFTGVKHWVKSNPRHSLSIAVVSVLLLSLLHVAISSYWDRVIFTLCRLVGFALFLPMVVRASFSSPALDARFWRLERCLSGAVLRTIWREMFMIFFRCRVKWYSSYMTRFAV